MRLNRLIVRARMLVLILAAAVMAVSLSLAPRIVEGTTGAGGADPASPSAVAQGTVHQELGGESTLVVLVRAPQGQDARDAGAAARDVLGQLRGRDDVESVHSYTDPGLTRPMVSRDGTTGMILGHLTGSPQEQGDTARELTEVLGGQRLDGAEVIVGGSAAAIGATTRQLQQDLLVVGTIAVPVTLILLLVVLGSAVSALLPLLVAAFGVLGGFGLLGLLDRFTPVSVLGAVVVPVLGLALAVGCCPPLICRFREELAAEMRGCPGPPGASEVREAVARTADGGARTVLWAGLVLTGVLAGLLVFPGPMLRTTVLSGLAVTLTTVLGAAVVLPALLAVVGGHLERGRVPSLLTRRRPAETSGVSARHTEHTGGWAHRHPVRSGLPVLAVLLALMTPLVDAQLGVADDRVLSTAQQARAAGDILREQFPQAPTGEAVGVVSAEVSPSDLQSYALRASTTEGVASVTTYAGVYEHGRRVSSAPAGMRDELQSGSWYAVRVQGPADHLSSEALGMIRELQAQRPPAPQYPVVYTGGAARSLDASRAVSQHLPVAVLLIALVTVVLVGLIAGSVLIPVAALLMNGLALGAVLGVLTLTLRGGPLSRLLGLEQGPLDLTMTVLLCGASLGLCLVADVFLISRLQEARARADDDCRAVREGLDCTGRITALGSLVMAVPFAALISSGVSAVALLGAGTALAVLLGGTAVRGVLVPAFLRLSARIVWCAPMGGRREQQADEAADRPRQATVTSRPEQLRPGRPVLQGGRRGRRRGRHAAAGSGGGWRTALRPRVRRRLGWNDCP